MFSFMLYKYAVVNNVYPKLHVLRGTPAKLEVM